MDLPAAQEDLLKALAATGKPLVVVLQNGSALAVNWAQRMPMRFSKLVSRRRGERQLPRRWPATTILPGAFR